MAAAVVPVFAPVAGVLAGHAPSRRIKPGAEPNEAAVWTFLKSERIDRTLDALFEVLATSGWLWRLEGGRNRPFTAKIIVPWLDLWCWSWHSARELIDALGGALALTLASPPPPAPEWPDWPSDPEWARIA